ncbi:digeranylgeranylglycerophospholipid reductase [Candidatus Micrarchaeota archaeon CG08_land_8_20_14_0_20_59_11]|nr:MAG: digeranylgeranylglycerophospholipid reductase [Candidatus Micrarchaeota archaeon CG08_land_8_20_14_0_20_59_11]
MAEHYDAIVIGCGPGGSFFAKTAAKKGMNVAVLDKKKDLGSPVRCGEGIATQWDASYGLPLNAKSIAMRIDAALAIAPNGKSFRMAGAGAVVERKIFDKFLAIDAARAGAHILPKTLVTDLVRENGKIAGVKAKRFGEEVEFRAPLVVSAEGMENTIARKAGMKVQHTLYDTDVCYEYEMANVPCEPVIELYFGNRISSRGYAWIFPKAKDVANVGIGVGGETGADPKALLDAFIRERPERFKKAEVIEVKGGDISVGASSERLVGDNFMVIGTAAHMVDPIHGGGMGLAIIAGKIAAEVVAEAHERKDYSRDALVRYEKEWHAGEGAAMLKRLKLRKAMEGLSDDDLNFIFENMDGNDAAKLMDGDFKSVVAKLLLKRPSLLKVVKSLM